MTTQQSSPSLRPFVLVGGYWLRPWAWREVSSALVGAGHRVEVPVLPGLGDGTPPEGVTLADQAATVLACARGLVEPVLVAHSGGGAIASAVTDIEPSAVARVVYVDSGPVADGQVPRPDLAGLAVVPVPTVEELDAMGPLTADLTPALREQLATRGVPQPGPVTNTVVELGNPLRLRVPSTLICCSLGAAKVQELAAAGNAMFAPLLELTDADYVDLPAGHWPMWSRPEALAACLLSLAERG